MELRREIKKKMKGIKLKALQKSYKIEPKTVAKWKIGKDPNNQKSNRDNIM